jgi:hypothetical protein
MPCIDDGRAIRMIAHEVMIANDEQVNEQAEEDQEDREADERIQQTKKVKIT